MKMNSFIAITLEILLLFSAAYADVPEKKDVPFELDKSTQDLKLQTGMYIVDDDYIIGVGDYFVIYLTGQMNVNLSVIVASNGKIFIPVIGELECRGKTIKEMREQVKVSFTKYYKDFEVVLHLVGRRQVRPFSKADAIFFVKGEVMLPGIYELRSGETLSKAIYAAGGFTSNADLRKVIVERSSGSQKEKVVIELHGLLINKQKQADIELKNGDVVTVPPLPRCINVSGEVNKPGAYEYVPEAPISYYIGQAGGFNEKAGSDGIEVVSVDGKKADTKDYIPQAGDTIAVPQKFFSFNTFRDYMQLGLDFLVLYSIYTIIFKK